MPENLAKEQDSLSQREADMTYKGRNLLKTLKSLIFELVEIEADVARVDMADRMASVRRIKRALTLHLTNTKNFKKDIDSIRKGIIDGKEKAVTDNQSIV